MPIIWLYVNHYDIYELPTSASESLKTFVELSRSDRRSSLIYVMTRFSVAKKLPWLTCA